MVFVLGVGMERKNFFESPEKESSQVDSYNYIKCHPALRNTVVLTRIFQLVNYEDLCASRLVCSNWRNAAECEFRKQSRISILVFSCHNETEPLDMVNKRSSQLSGVLHEILSRMPDIPVAVGILPCSISSEPILAHFLTTERKNINDLNLTNDLFKDINGNPIWNYEIRKLIGEKNIWLTSLKLSSNHFVISPSDIPSIKDLHLMGCTIKLDGGRISPRKVFLSQVQFIREDNSKSRNTFVNEFIDFDEIKSLNLSGWSTDPNLNIRLDMSKAEVTVDFISLTSMDIEWETAKWKVKRLQLAGVFLLQKTQMKIKSLEIKSTDKEIDLYAVPKTIESIYLHETTICSSSISFPNLKYLNIWNTRCAPLLPNFTNCPNLKSLELTLVKKDFKIDVSHLPRTVKNIKIKYADDWLVGDKEFVLDKLILGWQNGPHNTNQLKLLKPEHLVIDGYFEYKCEMDMKHILPLIKGPFKTVAIGRLLLGIEDLKQHPFSSMVDEISEYYLFSNGSGKSITKHDFKKMNSLLSVL